MSSNIMGIGMFLMIISIIRTFYVYFKHKDILIDDDPESRIVPQKSFSSFWVIFSFIIFLNGIGLIYIGTKKSVTKWIVEGAIVEFFWVLVLFFSSSSIYVTNFLISLAMIVSVLAIVETFIIYFEVERMDSDGFTLSAEKIGDTLKIETEEEPIEKTDIISSNPEVIPEFKAYETQIIDLKNTFNQKEENITNLINRRFDKEELSHDRFTSVIKNCHKIFYHQSESALNIVHLAPEYSDRLDESVKGKIGILESIIAELNNLIEEFIIYDGNDEKSDDDLKELFGNMDNLISSVKDYK